MEALREAHGHHEREREKLRTKYGDGYDHFERVHKELDSLSSELSALSDQSVQLDASFSKYGYSAHIRTKESPNASSANSLMGDVSGDERSSTRDWDAERHQGKTMQFFVRPVVRQYFHKGLLWRAQETAEVASYELFIDLFYVGILAITGDGAAEDPTGESLLKFVVTFIMAWKFWNDISLAIAWFDSDDIIRRLSVLFLMTCLLGLTTNMAASWDTTWTPLVAFYITGRFFQTIYYVWMCFLIPMVRTAMMGFALQTGLPALIWIGSIYVENPQRQALVWIAIVLDTFGNFFVMVFYRMPRFFGTRLKSWSERHFEFYPAMNIEHRIERMGAFVTLVFGYSVIALLYQSKVAFGINAFFGKAVLGLIQAFSFNCKTQS